MSMKPAVGHGQAHFIGVVGAHAGKADLLQQHGFNFRKLLHRAGDFHELALGGNHFAFLHVTLDLDARHQRLGQPDGGFKRSHNTPPHEHGEGHFGITVGRHDARRVGEILVGLRRQWPCRMGDVDKLVENGGMSRAEGVSGLVHGDVLAGKCGGVKWRAQEPHPPLLRNGPPSPEERGRITRRS